MSAKTASLNCLSKKKKGREDLKHTHVAALGRNNGFIIRRLKLRSNQNSLTKTWPLARLERCTLEACKRTTVTAIATAQSGLQQQVHLCHALLDTLNTISRKRDECSWLQESAPFSPRAMRRMCLSDTQAATVCHLPDCTTFLSITGFLCAVHF